MFELVGLLLVVRLVCRLVGRDRGFSWMTTVSVLALPLESIVNLTSVRDLGPGSSGIEVRLGGRCCLTGDKRPVRVLGRSIGGQILFNWHGLRAYLEFSCFSSR